MRLKHLAKMSLNYHLKMAQIYYQNGITEKAKSEYEKAKKLYEELQERITVKDVLFFTTIREEMKDLGEKLQALEKF